MQSFSVYWEDLIRDRGHATFGDVYVDGVRVAGRILLNGATIANVTGTLVGPESERPFVFTPLDLTGMSWTYSLTKDHIDFHIFR